MTFYRAVISYLIIDVIFSCFSALELTLRLGELVFNEGLDRFLLLLVHVFPDRLTQAFLREQFQLLSLHGSKRTNYIM